ncbi:MAG: hypothetical protein HPY75_06105 [Actinobacteria bacterium]|nr:hypothetical protein [Actinomycetota bacterium]
MHLKKLWGMRALIAIVMAAFIVSAASVCLVLVFSSTGEATGNMEKDRAKEVALSRAKELSPETVTLEETKEYSTEFETSYFLKNNKGKNIGIICADRSTGNINVFFDASENSGKRESSNVRISKEEAENKVRSFLRTRGLEIDTYALESDPLVCVGMEGPPDNPTPVYSYEFNYRMQIDGVFVDDNESRNGALTITLSPEDGSIKSFALPKKALKLADFTIDKSKIEKREAINIATEAVAGREVLEGTTPVVQTDGIELRYMLVGNSRLVPYWKVIVRYSMDNLANVKDIPEEAKYMGGCVYSVSAVDGQIIFEESY